MNRLTKNNYADDGFTLQTELNELPEYKSNHYTQAQYDVDLWNKVKAIEDIEEEIGLDLITLFKASKNGIFVEEQNTNEKEIVFEEIILDLNNNLLLFRQPRKEIGKGRNISQYSKTWALDKNELISEQLCGKKRS